MTIEGSGIDGYTPSSAHDQASVNATLSAGVATGTLETSGGSGGLWHAFKGAVTCMVVEGAHVTIGALGKDREVPTEGPPKAVSGEFAQLLTVEFGKYTDSTQEEMPTYTDRFGHMLGTRNEGVESSVAPNCGEAGALSSGYLPTFGGVFHLSPSITSPEDGSVSESGTVTLSGTAEPSSSIWLYEVGEEPEQGTLVIADAEGAWSLAVEELAVGVHVFSAIAQSGSKAPANTVEVEVVPPRPHAPSAGGTPPGEPSSGSGTPASGSGAGGTTQAGQVTSGLGLQAVLGSKEGKVRPPVPDAELASASLHVSPSGAFELPVSCPATESRCIGTIALQTLDAVAAGVKGHGTGGRHPTPLGLGDGSFDVAGGQTKLLTLHLSKRVRTLLAHKRLWQARATLVAHDPAGASHTAQATVKLLLPPARRH